MAFVGQFHMLPMICLWHLTGPCQDLSNLISISEYSWSISTFDCFAISLLFTTKWNFPHLSSIQQLPCYTCSSLVAFVALKIFDMALKYCTWFRKVSFFMEMAFDMFIGYVWSLPFLAWQRTDITETSTIKSLCMSMPAKNWPYGPEHPSSL